MHLYRALIVVVLGIGVVLSPPFLLAQQSGVVSTLHNLSVTGPGEVRAVRETQVCKFCHVPHNAEEPAPLWGHALSAADYETPELRRGDGFIEEIPQPDGSSRLCLSCHDGTVALGDIAGEPQPISMVGGDRLGPGRSGFLGTDLSGSHPISIVIPEGGRDVPTGERDMSLLPLSAVRANPDVKVDDSGKMQCTSCHDPHSDIYYEEGKVPHFWVKPTVDEVCLTCHAVG